MASLTTLCYVFHEEDEKFVFISVDFSGVCSVQLLFKLVEMSLAAPDLFCVKSFQECSFLRITTCVKCQWRCLDSERKFVKREQFKSECKENSAPRFSVLFSEDELHLQKAFVPSNTKWPTDWAVKVFFGKIMCWLLCAIVDHERMMSVITSPIETVQSKIIWPVTLWRPLKRQRERKKGGPGFDSRRSHLSFPLPFQRTVVSQIIFD